MTQSPSPDETEILLREARAFDVGDAVIASDAQGTIVYWNEKAASLYGWRADEAIGRDVVELMPTRGTSDEAMHIMEQLRAGRTWKGEFIVQHRDGQPVHVHVTDIPVWHEHSVIGVIGVSKPRRPTPPR